MLEIRDGSLLLMMVNTLKKDLESGKMLAVRYLLNAFDLPLEEIRNEIRFECSKEMLVLFYKFYRMDLCENGFGHKTICGSEMVLAKDSNKNLSQCPFMNGRQYESPSVFVEHKVGTKFLNNTAYPNGAINMAHGGFWKSIRKCLKKDYKINKINQITVKNSQKSESLKAREIRKMAYQLTLHSSFKDFYSLKPNFNDVEDDILLLKLQILLDQKGEIVLSTSVQGFLYTLFNETDCNITRTKIVQVITRTRNIKKNKDWVVLIEGKLKFPGIYKLTVLQVAVVLECLKFLMAHNIATSDVNVFLYRLMHSYRSNFVFFALSVLKAYKVFDKQVIEKCLKMERIDDLSYNTLISNISRRNARFTFRKIETSLLLFSTGDDSKGIIRRIVQKGSERLLVDIVTKYPSIGYFYDVLRKIKDDAKLIRVRKALIENLNGYSVDLLCQLIEMDFGFEREESKENYKKKMLWKEMTNMAIDEKLNESSNADSPFITNAKNVNVVQIREGNESSNENLFDANEVIGMAKNEVSKPGFSDYDAIRKVGRSSSKRKEINKKYTTFFKKALRIVEKTEKNDRLKILNHLISVCLRYGDIRNNNKLLTKFLKNNKNEWMGKVIKEGIEYFELLK